MWCWNISQCQQIISFSQTCLPIRWSTNNAFHSRYCQSETLSKDRCWLSSLLSVIIWYATDNIGEKLTRVWSMFLNHSQVVIKHLEQHCMHQGEFRFIFTVVAYLLEYNYMHPKSYFRAYHCYPWNTCWVCVHSLTTHCTVQILEVRFLCCHPRSIIVTIIHCPEAQIMLAWYTPSLFQKQLQSHPFENNCCISYRLYTALIYIQIPFFNSLVAAWSTVCL